MYKDKKGKYKLKLASKISLMVIIIVIISISISITSIGRWSIDNMKNNLERNVLNTVKTTKLSPILIKGLENPNENGKYIQSFLESIQNESEDIDIMVVADNNGIRYGHTLENRVGHLFSAEDHNKAIKLGKTYVSTGPGTLGDSMRAFAPIKNETGDILGFVMAGSLLTSIEIAKNNILKTTILFIILGSLFGIIGATYISNIIKKSLLGFEPDDIGRLYSENNAILATIKEGIIAIDENYKITVINDPAKKLLDLSDDNFIGKDIRDVFPKSKLINILESKESILDFQHSLNTVIVNSNNIPIIQNSVLIGAVSSFRDQTEIVKLSEEVTGVQKIVDSLRATTHEFKNKLHVILGFIELDKKDEAKSYISNLNNEIQNNVTKVLDLIKESTTAALIIGKINRANELNIHLLLDENSYFTNKFNFDINSLTVIVGNLIDNSLEHLDSIDIKSKKIKLLIIETDNNLNIHISDNGSGIDHLDKAFEKGFSTKDTGLGYGLYLVKNNVDKYNGSIDVLSNPNVGTTFDIYLQGDVKND